MKHETQPIAGEHLLLEDEALRAAQLAQPQHVAICVCTNGRPKGLTRLLLSLFAQQYDSRALYVRLIVAHNGQERKAETAAIVAALKAQAPFPVRYMHDDVAGIARARNRAAIAAIHAGADWIAFIDDDEAAQGDWLANLMAAEYRQYPVLMGRRFHVLPTPLPFWAIETREKMPPKEGGAAKSYSTANVRFSTDLMRDGGLAFDETLKLAGGEDQRFFNDAARHGYPIHHTNHAITREYAHRSRLTYWYQVGRAYAHQASLMSHKIRDRGRLHAVPPVLPSLVTDAVLGLLELAVSPLCAVAGVRRFKQFAMRGGKHLARVAGRTAAIVGHLPQPYRYIHGE